MPPEKHPSRQFQGVMVSSTLKDLENHRAALSSAIQKEASATVVMENDTARADVDVVDSSLQMVRDAAAYIVLIGMRYGQTPVCPLRNPDYLSITELEFNEAQRIDRPILLFIMGENHNLKKADIERDPAMEAKLDAFRERAKKIRHDSLVNRVYDTFNSLEEFGRRFPTRSRVCATISNSPTRRNLLRSPHMQNRTSSPPHQPSTPSRDTLPPTNSQDAPPNSPHSAIGPPPPTPTPSSSSTPSAAPARACSPGVDHQPRHKDPH